MATATAFDIPDEPIVQRTVSASNSPKPVTTAAASGFGIAGNAVKPKRIKLPPLKVDDLIILDDVPIPPRERGNAPGFVSPYKELLGKLKPGQSVVLAEGYAKSMASAAKKLKIPFSVRKLGDGKTGFWRLED